MNMFNGNFQEIGRKIIHVLVGIFALLMIVYGVFTPLVIFVLFIVFILFSLFSLKFKIPVAYFFLSRFERDREMHQLPGRGFLFAILGVLLSIQLFPRDIALASIIILTFADPLSYLVGKYVGKTRHFLDNRKNIEGNLAGFVISSALALFFVVPTLAIAGSLAAMLFEALVIEIQKIELDDNLIIPLAAGTTMFLIRIFLM